MQFRSRLLILPFCFLHMQCEKIVYICFLTAFWWLLNSWTSYEHADVSYAILTWTHRLSTEEIACYCAFLAPQHKQPGALYVMGLQLWLKNSVVFGFGFFFYFLLGFRCLPTNNLIDHLTFNILPACLNLIFDILKKSVTCLNKHLDILSVVVRSCIFLPMCIYLFEIEMGLESRIN